MVKIAVKKKTIQNIGLIILGIFLSLLILEVMLRIAGFGLLALQRQRNIVTDKTEDVYRILALGESTTAANIFYGQSSWPEELEVILNNKSKDIKFKVFKEGISGITTADILSHLKDNLDKYNPDIVITMMGTNDELYIRSTTLVGKPKVIIKDFRVYKLIKRINEGLRYRIRDYKKATAERKYREEEKSLKDILNNNPKNINAWINLIGFYEGHKRYKELLELGEKFVAESPNNAYRLHGLGATYLEVKEYEKAEKLLKKALEIEPNKIPSIYVDLGNLYKGVNKAKEAVDMYEKYFEITKQSNVNSYDENALIKLAELNIQLNNHKAAYSLLKVVISKDPDKIQEVFWIGDIYQGLNKTNETIEVFRKIIEKNPNNQAAQTELALWDLNHNRTEEAEEIFNTLMKRNSTVAIDVYYKLALWNLNYNRSVKAEEIFNALMKRNSTVAIYVYNKIGNYYRKMGESKKSDEMFNRASDLSKIYYDSSTMQQNYQELYEIINSRGIKLIIMQYPTLDIGELKKYFKENEGIIFVSNEENFKKALANATYENYFIDNFRVSWGHATKKGNQLIAENVANVILGIVEKVRRSFDL